MSFRAGQSVTISVSAIVTTIQTANVPQVDRGRLIEAKIVIPNVANQVTFTFSLLDREGHTRYSIAGLSDDAQTILLPARAVHDEYKFGITPSGATGTAIDVGIYPTYES